MSERIRISASDWERIGGYRLPIVYCPDCGGGLLGDSTHRIEENGDVNNSVVCPCGFHEFIKLEGWNPQDITPLDQFNSLVRSVESLTDEQIDQLREAWEKMHKGGGLNT